MLFPAFAAGFTFIAATVTTPFTTPETTADGLLDRTVNDRVRNLFPGSAKLLALVMDGQVRRGELVRGQSRISKKSSRTPRFESFTHSPLAIEFTVTSLSGTTLTLSSTTGLVPHMTFVNTDNDTTARIDSVTSSTVVEVTTFGTSTFAAVVTDKLLAMAPAYPENSKDPNVLMKEDDNIYNLLQIVRYPVSISASHKGNPQLAGGDFFTRLKRDNMIEGNRKIENTLLFSNRASGTVNTTAGGAILGDPFRTTRGIWNWAVNTFDASGSLTATKFRQDLPEAMSDTIDDAQEFVMFAGTNVFGIMQEFVNAPVVVNDTEKHRYEKFGIKAKAFETSIPLINLIRHDAFNRGSYTDQALIFAPEELFYCFKEGRDLQPRVNIQSPSTDGFIDEIFGEIGIGVLDGGNSITRVINIA